VNSYKYFRRGTPSLVGRDEGRRANALGRRPVGAYSSAADFSSWKTSVVLIRTAAGRREKTEMPKTGVSGFAKTLLGRVFWDARKALVAAESQKKKKQQRREEENS